LITGGGEGTVKKVQGDWIQLKTRGVREGSHAVHPVTLRRYGCQTGKKVHAGKRGQGRFEKTNCTTDWSPAPSRRKKRRRHQGRKFKRAMCSSSTGRRGGERESVGKGALIIKKKGGKKTLPVPFRKGEKR